MAPETEAPAQESTYERVKLWVFRVETWSVLLISLATVATAWSAYQSHRWGGVQSVSFGLANTSRTESVRASNLAAQQVAVDVNLFTDWAAAVAVDDASLADFLEERFRPEFVPAFDAWLELPGEGRIPPGTPFTLPAYRLAEREKSNQLADEASAHFEAAKDANQTGDNFVLISVAFASVLFFGGISTRFDRIGPKITLLGMGTAVFITAAVIEFLLPQNVGI